MSESDVTGMPTVDTGTALENQPLEHSSTADVPVVDPNLLIQHVEIKEIGPCKKHIKVSVDRAAIDLKLNTKYSELVVDANVAGFRPGKAPRKIIERRYMKEVGDQVKSEIMMVSLEQLAKEHNISPLTPPDLDPSKIDLPKQGPMVYEFNVEVRPDFDLPEYRNLKLKRPVQVFTDKDVAVEEDRMLAPHGLMVPKPEGNAQLGDHIVVSVEIQSSGIKVGDIQDVGVRIETQLAFRDGVAPRFAEQVMGANPGDTRNIDVVLSNDTAIPGLRGKVVQAVMLIKEVKSVRLPELTHELLHEHFGVHSPEQLRERIRVVLERRLLYHQLQSARAQVIEAIAAAATWDLPQDLLVKQVRNAMGRRVMEMQAAGMTDEEIRGRQRILQQDVMKSTALALKEHFVLQKIAEVENLEITEDEVNEEIENVAATNDESPRRLRARLEKEDHLEPFAIELLERKVLDLILQTATYEDVPLATDRNQNVATVEEQAIPGEMNDPSKVAPEEAKQE